MSLEKTGVQKIAQILKVLVMITFVCNLLALLMVPGLALTKGVEELLNLTPYENPFEVPLRLVVCFVLAWGWVWAAGSYEVVLTLFLWLCGTCTAVILWQARRVLDTVLKGDTFSMNNAANMKRAGVCCLIISVAALVRLIWGLIYYGDLRPLVTYNALFVPVFFMGFLLCTVMSALFRQAAELKEENDLTI